MPLNKEVANGDNIGVRLIVVPAAAKSLAELPARDRAALLRKLADFAAAPAASHPWARPLVGHPGAVRVRQGDWRAVCRIDAAAAEVIVDAVAHRREVYR